MSKVKNLAELRKLRTQFQTPSKMATEEPVHIKIAMATCSIASGSKETMNYIMDELGKRNIDAVVTQTGCMGYCYAEPTVEVTIPGREPVVFGYVNHQKADEIIEKYIKNNTLVEGIIPVNYKKIDE